MYEAWDMSLGASGLSAELLRRVVMKRCEMAKQMRTAKPAPTMTRKVTRTPFRAGGWLAGGPGTVRVLVGVKWERGGEVGGLLFGDAIGV
jgi:hypothetical protein